MPVIAVAPEPKARRMSRKVSPSVAVTLGCVATKSSPAASPSPTAMSTSIPTMNAYVGIENSLPAWRTPRRLP